MKGLKLSNIVKYMFLLLIVCVVYFGINNTYCDVHVVSTKHGSLIFLDDETYYRFTQNTKYASEQRNAYFHAYEEPTAEDLLRKWNESDASLSEKERAFDAIYNSIIVYHSCNAEIKSETRSMSGHSYTVNVLYADGTTSVETRRTETTYASQWKNQNGYKILEEISQKGYQTPSDELTKNQIDILMNDAWDFACGLGDSDALKKEDKIKQRLQEFCYQVGTSREVAYGLIKYAKTYGDENIKERINNNDFTGKKAYFSEYLSGNDLIAYDGNCSLFYYFLRSFYETDKKGIKNGTEAYSINDMESYYIGLAGHINISSIEPLKSGLGVTLGNAFMTVLSSATDDLATSVVTSITRDACWGILNVIRTSEESIMNFCPSIEQYLEYFGGIGNENGKITEESTPLFDLNNLFYWIGAILLVLITIIQLVTIIVNPEEAKTDIPHLITRFIILSIFIYWGRNIIGYIFDFTNLIWERCFSASRIASLNPTPDMSIIYKSMNLVTYDYFGINWNYSVVGVIFNCAIGFIIMKNIFMVLAECIERYIVAVLLYFTFPTALSFGVSNTTSNILISYFRMLGTQLFMLFMNLYFIHGFLILLDNMTIWADSFYGLIFVIAYLKVAQAFDSYLSSLGLSVAHTSGRMASELLGVGSTLLAGTMMLGRIGMSVGRGLLNTGARGVGSALSTGAIMSGSQGNGALKAFNMGENLRAQGLRGLLGGGARLNANTLTNLNSAQTGRFGLTQASTFKNAMAGGINGGILNANKQTSGKALLDALGTGLTANGRISDAKFNSLGGGLAINGSVKTAGGKTIATSGQLSLTDSQLKAGHGISAPRTFGVAMSGDVMRGTFAYNTSVASGDSFKLNKDSIQKVGGEYVVTDAELGLGANFLANEAVRTHTLDLASQGHDITLTKQANGNIMVSDGSDIIGYTSEHGDRWFTDSKERAITTDDFNGGALTYLRPNENCEAINIITMDEVKDGTLLNPTSMDFLKDHNFGEDATIVLFKDKETDELYAKEVHPTMESESENVRGDYTVVNLDTKSYNEDDGSTVIKGDEDQIYDRDYRKVGNNRHPKNP